MAGRTVTRADLSEAVYQKLGLSRTESAALVERVLEEICAGLAKGDTVKLSNRPQSEDRGRGAYRAAPRHGVQALQRVEGPYQWRACERRCRITSGVHNTLTWGFHSSRKHDVVGMRRRWSAGSKATRTP
jgi:hypothetical protein